ncbi:MAG: 6-phosphogluconolactonase [Candidatus Rokubacteria bacterium]|nr:6-phosphogluconolactonase [Candidatus Rokubacteria bacterium]
MSSVRAKVVRLADAEAVSAAAARDFVALSRDAVAARGSFTVALSGGSTPRRLYQLLAEAPYRSEVAWERVEFFWGDERAVPPDHPDSNYRMAAVALLEKIGAAADRIHRIQAERADRDAAARHYQLEIARVFGVNPDGPPPALDLVLLGMGPDGHTASLFPHTAALREGRGWVMTHFVERLGAERITLTVPVLNRAREIRFLVAGSDKAATLRAVLEGPRDPERLPSQLIRPEAGRLVWLVDRAAAAELGTVEGRV